MLEPLASLTEIGPTAIAALALLLVGGGALAWPMLAGDRAKSDVKRRLRVEGLAQEEGSSQPDRRSRKSAVQDKAVKTAQEFYAKSDPESVARIRLKLIQAGYMDPSAVGRYFLCRFAGLVAGAVAGFVLVEMLGIGSSPFERWGTIGALAIFGYFLPGLVLSRIVAARMGEYRNGFPDFMDLMIVCCGAGMSMEAGIERVAREISVTYPSLGQNLQLVSIELRAGRGMDDALKSLGDRLSLEEVRSFATLLQQSRELGTSLSGALRVFSDDMRNKRMSVAEEKAHALPAKMSVPVTVCILPVVILIAIIPVIVKYSAGIQ